MADRSCFCAATIVIGIALSPLCIGQTRVEQQARSSECQARYRPQLPAGATPAKAEPIRLRPAQFDTDTAYACIVVSVDENGRLTESKIVETDQPAFAEHLLEQVRGARWQPAMLDGRPFATQAVVSAVIAGASSGEHLAYTVGCVNCHHQTHKRIINAPPLVVVKAYSLPEFQHLMKTGITRTGRNMVAEGSVMGVVAQEQFSHFTEAEVRALYRFLTNEWTAQRGLEEEKKIPILFKPQIDKGQLPPP